MRVRQRLFCFSRGEREHVVTQQYKVWLVAPDDTLLDVSDGTNYLCDTQGLHDLPQREMLSSPGYQAGSHFYGSRALPRTFSLTIHIEAGEETWPVRNAAHNAARDDLIRFLPEGELIRVRTQYLGTSGYWEIEAFVQQLLWQQGTPSYIATLIAPDPRLKSTILKQTSPFPLTLPDGSWTDRTFTVDVGGNVPTEPLLLITPTAAKTSAAGAWLYVREYTVTNPTDKELLDYPICLNFNFAAAISGGKLLSNYNDLRVFANDVEQDRWLGNEGLSTGKIWVYLDLPADDSITVRVIYGWSGAPTRPNSTLGPIFDLDSSDNAHWVYDGAFMDPLGSFVGSRTTASVHGWKWNVHQKQALGFVPLQAHIGSMFRVNPDDPNAVNAAGAYVGGLGAVRVQGYAGAALHHPLLIDHVVFSGVYRYDSTEMKLTLRGYDIETGALTDVWDNPGSSPLVNATFGPITHNFTKPMEAVVFALRSMSVHDTNANYAPTAGADYVEVWFPNDGYPTADAPSELGVYFLDFTITNNTTGDEVRLRGIITKVGAVWQTAEIDFEEMLATMAGEPFYYAVDIGPVRPRWFRLKPGENSITISDEAVVGLEVRLSWRDRRL